MLVLLIIFMLTSIAIVRASMVVNLPKAATGGARVESTVNVVCNKDGSLMLNGAPSTVAGDRQVREDARARPTPSCRR